MSFPYSTFANDGQCEQPGCGEEQSVCDGGEMERALAMEQLIYEIACDELPYTRFAPREVLQVQERRRRRIEELKSLILGERR